MPAVLAFVLLAAGMACGGVETAANDPPGTEQARPDAGTADGVEGDSDTPHAGVGFISVNTHEDEGTDAKPVFVKPDFPEWRPIEADGCAVYDSPGPGYVEESAGTIEVTAGSRSAAIEFLTGPDGTGVGYPLKKLSGGTAPLSPEMPILVRAPGAVVPAFELSVIPVERPAITTSPADGLVAGQPFEVSWAAVAADRVLLRLEAAAVLVSCNAEASKGKIAVTSERIAKLVTDPSKPVMLTVAASRESDGRFEGFHVRLVHTAFVKPVALPIR